MTQIKDVMNKFVRRTNDGISRNNVRWQISFEYGRFVEASVKLVNDLMGVVADFA